MPYFKSRVPAYELDRLVLHHLLVGAVEGADPAAGAELHRLATGALGHVPDWDWWTKRCEDAERRGRRDVALLGVEFALGAVGAPWGTTWGTVSRTDHGHLELLRLRLLCAADDGADDAADDTSRLRRPDRARFPERAQGSASTAG